jgi:hypothetical protein
MATGLLGQAALSAATNTSVYVVPATTFTVFSVSVLNRGSTTVAIRLALSASATTPTTAEYIEYDVQIAPNGVLERTGLMMNAAKYLVVYASNANVSVSAYGIETSTV